MGRKLHTQIWSRVPVRRLCAHGLSQWYLGLPHCLIGDPHLVICMDCSADTMTNRLLQRNQSSQHVDDTTKTIAKRLETYYRASIPVMAYYETKTKLQKVNAEGTPEEVFLQLCTAIDSIF
uniref:Adenylate kinase isoenzyme 5-like n=2 Tax=Castor canadensis TaxID=51338 RepID=A0A8B7UBU7_CASCN|nr:adenylate kinase isoenzyme 5-like [Castor canadensis]